MKKRSRITVLYAAPPIRPRPGDEPEENENKDYPKNFEVDPRAFEAVYAGPDYFIGMNAMGAEIKDVYAGPAVPPPEEPEEPEELSEEELGEMKHANSIPPGMMGLVQCDPTLLKVPPSMQPVNTPNFCRECGAKTQPGDKFCRECGTKLV